MNDRAHCLKCGALVAPSSRQEFCPACLLDQALAASSCAKAEPAEKPESALPAELAQPRPLLGDPIDLPRRFGDYELLDKIGEGGMGVVYKARQQSLDRLVALKLLPLVGPHARFEFIERFRAEALAAASLQHPSIVAIHEVGVHEGRHFFAMDYVAGRSLAEMTGNRPLPPRQAARYLQAIAEAVHYAHGRGVLHRDLKPSNILIDAHDLPHVADFGLAKRLDSDSDLTLTGQVLGSPHYIPPEQAAGKTRGLDQRIDVYGLGAILYHLLTGRPPFVGERMAETLQLVLNADPVAPRSLNPLVPRDLETICLKCLEKQPARRYPTAQAVAEELACFLENVPIVARPVGPFGKAWRWCQRKPALAGALAALALTAGLGFTGILWQWSAARSHAAAERQQRSRAEEMLAHTQLERAEDLFEAGHTATALAWLAQVLRNHPYHPVAPSRLVSALTWRNFPLPLAEFTNITCAAWSPESRRIATGSINAEARVWTALGGQPLTPPLRHAASVSHVSFAPDGSRLVTASEDGAVRVWDAGSGQLLLPALQHTSSVVWAASSADGKRIGSASRDGSARIWDATTGEPVTPWLVHTGGIFTARFSPDGRLLLTAAWERSLRLWHADTGHPYEQLPVFNGRVRTVAFSPDSRRLVASDGKNVCLWDLATGKMLAKPITHSEVVIFAGFSPDGGRVLTCSFHGYLYLWDATTTRELTHWRFLEDPEKVRRLWESRGTPLPTQLGAYHADKKHAEIEFSPDGQRVVCGSDDWKVGLWNLWDLDWNQYPVESIQHERELRTVSFSPEGQHLLTRSADGVARVWDVRPGMGLSVLLRTGPLERAVFGPDGRRVVTGNLDGVAQLWDASTGQMLIPEMRHDGGVFWVEFSPDGRCLVTASSNHTARVWDARSGQPLAGPLWHGAPVKCARFSRDGQRIITASDDRTARVWDVRSAQPLSPPLRHELPVCWVAFAPEGERVVTASWDRTASVWDAHSGQRMCPPLRHEQSVLFAEFTRDGHRVVTAGEDGAGRFWDARTGQPLGPALKHAGWVLVVRLHPEGALAATASTDTTARLWDLASGQAVLTISRHNRTIEDVLFSPDGRWLATASGDHTARLWDVRTGLPAGESFRLLNRVNTIDFSPDGQRLLTGSRMGVRLWEVPQLPLPAPDWLPRLAEGVGGRRLNELRQLEPVPVTELMAVRRQLEASTATDPYTLWAHWFCADRAARPKSPGAAVTVARHVQLQIEEGGEGQLRHALFFSPTNRAAFLRLAAALRARGAKATAPQLAEADWCERKAQE